ncbi:MAG TPA: TetR/AcrR family transcriptional regulator [Sporichthyaceae bacterium]|nr:TetR/AcrR family transcriptional regulator [Sporichthyaceae bacterium]
MSSRTNSGGTSRLRREDWFEPAFALLGSAGPEALTIASLCRRLRVTKGSFYHHFVGMPEFVEALLRDWEARFAAILDEVAGLSDPVRRSELTAQHIFAMDHDAEAALRAWSYRDPVVAAAVERMDRARAQNYANTLALSIDDPERCRVLAAMGTAVLIGLQMSDRPVDRERFLRVALEWAQTNVGLTVEAHRDGDQVRIKVVGRRGRERNS